MHFIFFRGLFTGCCWLLGLFCFVNANRARCSGEPDPVLGGCERRDVNAAKITRQSKYESRPAFISLGRERRCDITIFYAFAVWSTTSPMMLTLLRRKNDDGLPDGANGYDDGSRTNLSVVATCRFDR